MRCAVSLLLCLTMAAQDPRFETQSRVVLIPVTVTDAKGRTVDGLGADDFTVLDNGRPQKLIVDTFTTGVAPIALVIAVQSAGISAPVLAKVRKIGAMIQPLVTGDRGCAALVAFDEQVRWLQECTKDQDALSAAFLRLRPGEERSARMLDAVHEAVDRLHKVSNVRRVLLLLSESRDRGSQTALETVLMNAQSAGVTVYAATYSAFRTAFTTRPSDTAPPELRKDPQLPSREPESPPGRERVPVPTPSNRVDLMGIGELMRLGKTNTAQVLTTRTGGTTFAFARQKGLEDAVEKLGSELHAQYVLSFTPELPAPGYHHLEIKLGRRNDLRIRARPGYWASGL